MSKSINNKTHRRIVECALKLFREKGYDNVTIQEICQSSKITKSTFYYHFPSKESLIEEFTEQTSRTTQENFAEIMALESNILQLWAIFNSYIKKNDEYGSSVVGQVYRTFLSTCDEIDFPRYLILFNTVVILIEKAQKFGEIQNMSQPEQIAEALYYGSRGIVYSWAAGQGGFCLQEKFKNLFNGLLLPVKAHAISFEEENDQEKK